MSQSQLCAALLFACLAAAAVAQEIRSYTRAELFPGQICGDDGQGWEWKNIGECPQGYNGIRKWAKERGILPGSKATTPAEDKEGAFRLQKDWPFCNPCKDDQSCYEFKPGVSKCITKTESGEAFLKEGELCMDFSGKKRKWAGSNPKLFGMSCQWPQFSCNYDTEADNGTYKCERIRSDAGQPVKQCYRALGGRWWGGSDQWYAWNNGKFTPCGGPNPDYKKCTEYGACGDAKPWPWADEKGTFSGVDASKIEMKGTPTTTQATTTAAAPKADAPKADAPKPAATPAPKP
jgi:hypothetical protein